MARSFVLALLLSVPALAHAQEFGPAPGLSLGGSSTQVAPPEAQGQQPVTVDDGPRVVFRLHAGGQIGELSVAGRRGLLYYGRVGFALGHELAAAPTGVGRFSLSLEYDGSVSLSPAELIHRHGATLTVGFPSAFLGIGGGVAIGHPFQDPTTVDGGHFGLVGGLRVGNFLVAVPFDVDVFGRAVAVTIGLGLGVTTN